MADVVFLVLTVAFFAIALALVRACERLVGDERPADDLTERSVAHDPERVAA